MYAHTPHLTVCYNFRISTDWVCSVSKCAKRPHPYNSNRKTRISFTHDKTISAYPHFMLYARYKVYANITYRVLFSLVCVALLRLCACSFWLCACQLCMYMFVVCRFCVLRSHVHTFTFGIVVVVGVYVIGRIGAGVRCRCRVCHLFAYVLLFVVVTSKCSVLLDFKISKHNING